MNWTNAHPTTYEFICSHFNAPKEYLRADLWFCPFGEYSDGYFHAKLLNSMVDGTMLFFPGDCGTWYINTNLHYDVSNKNLMFIKDGDWLICIYVDNCPYRYEIP